MIVVLDACVLYPPSLRDLLMWPVVVGCYQPRWTDEIHGEWMRAVVSDHPEIEVAQLERTRRLMDQIDPGSLVTDYEEITPGLLLPDPDDRHVLAAGIRAGATAIITYNLSDFPPDALARHGLRAMHPDALLIALLRGDRPRFLEGVRRHRASLRNPPKDAMEYLEFPLSMRLDRTAGRLATLTDRI